MNFDFLQILGYPLGFVYGLIAFILIFIPAVCIHEFGHLLIARLFGVRVPEYAVGMPFTKRLFYFKKFGIVWSFYPILLGGFVRLYGDSDAIDHASEDHVTDPQTARQNYINARLEELKATQMLEFFLKDNSLEYDESWKEFEKFDFSLQQEIPPQIAKQKKQIDTLIDWEFDRELVSNDTMFSKNWLQQTLIIMGGIIFNFATAILCFAMIFGFVLTGPTPLPKSEIANFSQRAEILKTSDYVTATILEKGVAEKNGVVSGDKLYSIADKKFVDFASAEELSSFLQTKRDQQIPFSFAKKGTDQIQTKSIKLEQMEGSDKVLFGIRGDLLVDIEYRSKGIFESLGFGYEQTRQFIQLNFEALGKIGQALLPQTQDRSALNQLGGPVGASNAIVDIFSKLDLSKWLYMYLQILAVISISLGVFNILPFPALDGGRWVIITLTKLLGRRNRKLENIIIGYSFTFLMGLGIIIMFKDAFGIIFKR
jgi:regulator of sigma E protease